MEVPTKLIWFLVLFFYSFQWIVSAYTPVDNYLIACGSTADITEQGRTFIGDATSSGSSFLSKSDNRILTDVNASSSSQSIYNTARVFTAESSYKFPIRKSGTHFVRLHFFPFNSSQFNLSSAVFNVSVSGSVLLSEFTARKEQIRPKEFIIPVSEGNLEIKFSPSGSSPSPFAFVNALEVISTPDKLIPGSADLVTDTRGSYSSFSDKALETIFRVNIGGPLVTASTDLVWRTWSVDDQFIRNNETSLKVSYSGQLSYKEDGANEESAPAEVYKTARKLSPSKNSSLPANVTWYFQLDLQAMYFIRMHFCDFDTPDNTLYFSVYINKWEGRKDINPNSITGSPSFPFYMNFVSKPGSDGILKISISSSSDPSYPRRNATLNGVEIMKINNFSVVLDKSSSIKKSVLVGSIVGGIAVIILLTVAVILVCKRRKKSQPTEAPTTVWSSLPVTNEISYILASPLSSISPSPMDFLDLKISIDEIKFATQNFSEDHIVGTGGFGSVYKGVFRDGTKVAVKRGIPGRQGFPEFQTEILILSKIRHRHLVSLVGYCEEESEMLLVYEYMEKGTLKSHLYGSNLPILSWKQRLEICIGAARGLHYLHTGSAEGIIHRDVKTANILLDEDLMAKLADFGLSKSGPAFDQTHVSTAVKGSFGYLDPEYYRRQKLTDKSDVYSFGVVLFEVLTGRPAIDPSLPREQVNLAEWASSYAKRGLLEDIIDPQIRDQVNKNSIRKFGETALKCLSEYGVDRPNIGDVLWNLEYALQLQETVVVRVPFDQSSSFPNAFEVPLVQPVTMSSDVVSEDAASGNIEVPASESHVFSQLLNSEGR